MESNILLEWRGASLSLENIYYILINLSNCQNSLLTSELICLTADNTLFLLFSSLLELVIL